MTATKKPKKLESPVDRAAPMFNKYGTRITALELRHIRQTIRQTASLMANDGPIYEMPGENWAASIKTRTIYWRSASNLPPYDIISQDELLFLTVHEAYHIKVTGGWDCPVDFHPLRWHRFCNACEDIRIERIAERDFPGFAAIRHTMDTRMLNEWLKPTRDPDVRDERALIDGACLMDQVWLNWHRLEHGLETAGHSTAQSYARNTWPDVSRICNASSSEKMAKMLEPFYRSLQAPENAKEGQPGGDTAMQFEPPAPKPSSKPDGDGDSSGGGDQPDEPLSGESSNQLGAPSSQSSNSDTDSGETYDDSDASDTPTETPERSKLPTKRELSEGSRQTFDSFDETDQKSAMAEDASDRATRSELAEQVSLERAQRSEAKDTAHIDASTKNGSRGQKKPESSSGNVRPVQRDRGDQSWDHAKRAMRPHINVLARRLQATLHHNAADDWEPGLRRGQLDAGQAWRSVGGAVDIFRDRSAVGDIDHAFGIIVDVSSSQRKRANELLRAAVLVGEALESAGLGWFMLPWSNEPREGKRFQDTLISRKGALGAAIGNPIGGTYEAPALIFAEDEFAHVKSGHRFLITITDGQTRGIDESKQLIDELEASGIKCLAISIACHEVMYYSTRMRVNNAAGLVKILPTVLAQTVKRG